MKAFDSLFLSLMSGVAFLFFAGCATTDDVASTSGRGKGELISNSGIGFAKLGMTADQVRQALPMGYSVASPPVRNYLKAVAWHKVFDDGGDLLYTFLVKNWQNPTEDSPIVMVRTRNKKHHTAEGLHPGSSLAKATELYGAPVGIRRPGDLGNERVEFLHQPPYLSFEARSRFNNYAGIYPELTIEQAVNEDRVWSTDKFRSDVLIFAITVQRPNEMAKRFIVDSDEGNVSQGGGEIFAEEENNTPDLGETEEATETVPVGN
ncbi:MAG: hypothetical protein ACK5NG_09390 [Chthoniobacterales bacterium]